MEYSIKRLTKITDLLGPGLWLDLDKVAFCEFFGGEMGQESSEIVLQRFAKQNSLSVIIENGIARFGRAYPKKLEQ